MRTLLLFSSSCVLSGLSQSHSTVTNYEEEEALILNIVTRQDSQCFILEYAQICSGVSAHISSFGSVCVIPVLFLMIHYLIVT